MDFFGMGLIYSGFWYTIELPMQSHKIQLYTFQVQGLAFFDLGSPATWDFFEIAGLDTKWLGSIIYVWILALGYDMITIDQCQATRSAKTRSPVQTQSHTLSMIGLPKSSPWKGLDLTHHHDRSFRFPTTSHMHIHIIIIVFHDQDRE